MPWQVTTLVHRVRTALDLAHAGSTASTAHAPAFADAGPVAEVADRVLHGLRSDEQAAYRTWVADRPEAAGVLARALATTRRLAPVAELASAWAGWDAEVRAAVADPVRHLTAAGRQTDQTTCGSASLTMLAAAGDPALAAWLACGWVPQSLPPELSGAGPRALAVLADRPAADRFGALQTVLHRRSNVRGLGPLPWPQAFGTPPWGAARTARFPGVRYRGVMLDDTDREHLDAVLAKVAGWVGRGVPVPLFAGGDSATSWQDAIPRHVVLAVGAHAGGLEVFEPSVGRLLPLAADGSGRRPALGGWSHLAWAVLPVRSAGAAYTG